MITCTGARDVEQVPLRVVNLFEVGVVSYRLNSLLRRDNFVITGHDHYRTELQSFRKVHRADGDMVIGRLDILIKYLERQSGSGYRILGTIPLSQRRHANPQERPGSGSDKRCDEES